MTKYSGVISVGAVAGGGYATSTTQDGHVTSSVPIAVELVSFRIGDTFFRKLRMCQQFVSQFIHPGDDASIYVYKQLGFTDVLVGVKSGLFPSYSISLRRLLLMLFSQYLFGTLFLIIPVALLFGWFSPVLAIIALLVPPTYGSWTLIEAYREMRADGI